MIKHLFKIIWNRKKTNFTMSLGIFISFIVLFLVMSFIVYTAKNYFAPLGFDYKDVWYISMDWKDSSPEEIKESLIQMENSLKGFDEIEEIAYSLAFVFIPSVLSTTNFEYEDKSFSTEIRKGSDGLEKVLKMNIIKGRWFNEGDDAATKHPLVINQRTKNEIFGDDIALGKILKRGETEYQVIGIIDEFKNGGLFSSTKRISFQRISMNSDIEFERFSKESMGSRILLKMRPNTNIEFEETLLKNLMNIAKNWQIKVNSLEAIKDSASLQSLIFPIIFAAVCGFLIINVGLGLFGVIWYNTNRRKSEVGLRRALGSTIKEIHSQIIGEAVVLSTFALIFGSLFTLQFPLLGLIPLFNTGIYTVAYFISIGIIYLLTAICAMYPSWIAAGIEPAEALRDE
jgi:putative ABC transport system permease protein